MSGSAHPADLQDIAAALAEMGLLGEGEQFTIGTLSGGVSCDVYRVAVKRRPPLVVKRALPQLRVAAAWRAPPERAAAEVAWLKLVAGIEPHWVPRILGEDRARHLFAMEFFAPERYPVWKAELAAGRVDAAFAAQVGAALARIHAATAGRAEIAAAFDHGAQFRALRLEPYLLYTAQRHPLLAPAIEAEAGRLAAARIALMQGDISPKNILCGPDGPVFLDAETACYGDPAFDLAFCLNHLLLKCVWHPEWTAQYAGAFHALKDAYRRGVAWEAPDAVDGRTARLLPMLLLARVDGKSPVEYLTAAADTSFVRAAALQMIVEPPTNLAMLAEAYFAVAGQR
ncbi:MAG TPA: aminoglycoside phosphotransferase family protein [Rhizomicrobium sp.]|jgi:aminoglycoside phosphotransferase (APT) family kinase protein|nr:aminoglycoside phosphotransferase family protein [Rhizomicrobium sp.]